VAKGDIDHPANCSCTLQLSAVQLQFRLLALHSHCLRSDPPINYKYELILSLASCLAVWRTPLTIDYVI
jgi:hypothetical protein